MLLKGGTHRKNDVNEQDSSNPWLREKLDRHEALIPHEPAPALSWAFHTAVAAYASATGAALAVCCTPRRHGMARRCCRGSTFDEAVATAAVGVIRAARVVVPYLGLHKRGHLHPCCAVFHRQGGSLSSVGFGGWQRLKTSPDVWFGDGVSIILMSVALNFPVKMPKRFGNDGR